MVLCENGLASRQGHHLNLVVGIRAELARRGLPLTVLSHVNLDPKIAAELEALPVFERTPYASLSSGGRGRQILSWLVAAKCFTAGLRRVELGPDDVLLVMTVRPAELAGLDAWSWTRRRLPRAIVLNFMTDDRRPARTGTSPALVRVLYTLSFALLKLRVGRRRLLLTCASERLAAPLSAQLHERVSVSPVLHSYSPGPARPAEPRAAESPTIGFLGTPRPDKGEPLLAELIDACAQSLPRARVVAQVGADFAGPPGGWPENVQLMPVGLEHDRYQELLSQVDIVVLPYVLDQFGDMVSGVFSDAVASGAVAVAPAGSWMATMIERGRAAGVVFDQFAVSAIVGAAVQAADDLEELRRQAASLRAPWRAEQSISAYFEQLLGELSSLSRARGADGERDRGSRRVASARSRSRGRARRGS